VRRELLLILAMLAILSLGMVSCGERFDEEEDPSLSEIVKIGKGYLKENRGAQAAEAFKVARAMDDTHPEANFGVILSHSMQLINLVDMVIDLASSLFYTAPQDVEPGPENTVVMAQSEPIGDFIQEYLGDTIEGDFVENEVVYLEMADREDFEFRIAYYPIVLGGERVAVLKSEFDKTDLHLFGAVTSLVNAVVDIVQAHDLNFDLNALIIPTMDFTNDLIGSLVGIADLLEGLLTDPEYPNFLLVKTPDGLERMKSAGINLGNAFERIVKMFDQLGREHDLQTDDPINYLDTNKNNQYDSALDPVQIASMLTLEPDLVRVVKGLATDLSYVFWEGSTVDPKPDQVDKLSLGMFNDLLIYLGLLRTPILPDSIGIEMGSFFSDPTEDGLRSMLLLIVDLIDQLAELVEGANQAA
jgi:hypothetical protein